MGEIVIAHATPDLTYADMIGLALKKTDSPYTKKQFCNFINDGIFNLLGIKENGLLVGHCTYRIERYPECKKLVFGTLSGVNYDSWGAELTNYLVNIAKKNKCKSIIGQGRDGWLKKMKGFSRKPIITLEMEV